MNNEKRDQMIHETFDQCLSGIDSLPSMRQEILREARGKKPERAPVRFRALAAAAMMVVLLCVGVLAGSGRLGFLNGQDQKHQPAPIETALSAGTEQESPRSVWIDPDQEGRNVFEWFSSNTPYSWIGKLSAGSTEVEVAAQEDAKYRYAARYYYDGETLVIATVNPNVYSLDACDMSELDLTRMDQAESDENAPQFNWDCSTDPGLENRWNESIRTGKPMALVMHSKNIRWQLLDEDHNLLDSGLDAVYSTFTNTANANRQYHVTCCRYGEQLPDQLRNRDSFNAVFEVKATTSYYYFDGKTFRSYSADDDMHTDYITVPVVSSQAEMRYYSGKGMLQEKEMDVQGMVSGNSIRITISVADPEASRDISLAEDTKVTCFVQDEKGTILFRDSAYTPERYEGEDSWTLTFPLVMYNPAFTGTEELPSSLRVYLQLEPADSVEAAEADTGETEDEDEGLPRDDWGTLPDIEPFAILTLTEPADPEAA